MLQSVWRSRLRFAHTVSPWIATRRGYLADTGGRTPSRDGCHHAPGIARWIALGGHGKVVSCSNRCVTDLAGWGWPSAPLPPSGAGGRAQVFGGELGGPKVRRAPAPPPTAHARAGELAAGGPESSCAPDARNLSATFVAVCVGRGPPGRVPPFVGWLAARVTAEPRARALRFRGPHRAHVSLHLPLR